ncbi:Sec-independent protein translocase protein TatB [Parvularcula sp. LCG005]|uniref:Sec-independent protein translocase protein TatB n=1 Tax=Parvularcula sp. LCG005 TaxID=3078805 RepID=UPI0029430131|nr:Sec-independent protein translocase protein TatB [Parvularcula sp. LCG005]WOI52428.1 Sec-independent protein translocase protein TatB [Parvularcula sp. LCG005]
MAELLVIGMVALIIIGPKDLPRLMYRVGKIFRHIRGLADEFKSSFDQMAREAELEDMRKEIEALKAANPTKDIKSALDDVDRPASAKTASARPQPAASTTDTTAPEPEVTSPAAATPETSDRS